jgi:Cof subfamily protein (haloacid dehalogenase superfamily)
MPELLPGPLADLDSLRPFSRIRLVAFDLDGTLLPHDLELKFLQLSRSVRKLDVRLVVATGRTLAGVDPFRNRLLLPGSLAVLYNGSLVVDSKTFQVVANRTIPADVVREILRLAGEESALALAYYYHSPIRAPAELFGPRETVVGWSIRPRHELSKTEFNNLAVDWLEDLNNTPCEPATAVLIQIDGDRQRSRGIIQRLSHVAEITVTQSGAAYLEIRPRGSNKAVALAEVAARLGVDRSEVLTVGDNDNDAEMLQWAGIGVAIDNASPLALESANYVSRRGTFSGVVEMLRIVRDAKRFFS